MNEVMVVMGGKQIVKINDYECLRKEKKCMGGERCYNIINVVHS